MHSLNRYSDALRALDKAIEISPNKGYYYASKGTTLYCSNQYKLAIQNVRQALKLEPNKHWSILAQIHIYNKNFEEALICIDKALITAPNNEFFRKLKLVINSGFKYGENFHIPIERSLLLLKIPPDDEIIYSTRLNIKMPDKKLFTDAIITKMGISTSFPYSGIQFARWKNIRFTRGSKFKISNYSCSLRWESRHELSEKFYERKKTFSEDINRLRNS